MTRAKVTPALLLLIAVALSVGRAPAHAQGGPPEGRPISLTGTVVDAACYMIHPPAASSPSHEECGAACLARGVPLAIANETDGAMYGGYNVVTIKSITRTSTKATL